MIVEPTPATLRRPIGRALRALGLATPLVLLAAVVGLGLAGPRPAAPDAAPSGAASSPGHLASPADPVAPAPTPGIAARPMIDAPASVAGLRVRSVVDAQPILAAARGSVIAVAGWLGPVETADACPTGRGDPRAVLGPLCPREARLDAAGPGGRAGAHLHVRLPPGVRLPPALEASRPAAPIPMAVVVIGHAAPPMDACTIAARGCDQHLVADRIAWAGGEPFESGVVFDAGLEIPPAQVPDRDRDLAEAYAAGPNGVPLLTAIVRPATVALIDPEAGAALATSPAPRPRGLVWYVRALVGSGDGAALRWSVVDQQTGARLATAGDDPSGPGAADAFPPVVAGLPVRSIEAAIADHRSSTLPRVVAVAGYLRAWADPARCTSAVPGLPADGCPRAGIIAMHTFSESRASGSMDFGTHLHAFVPAGVLVPERAVGLAGTVDEPAPAVVVIARFGEPTDTCAPDSITCEAFFALESVAWIAGEGLGVEGVVAADTPVRAGDRVAGRLPATFRRVFGPGSVRLRAALVRVRDLTALDRLAAATLAGRAGAAASRPAWYLRALLPDGTIHWAIVRPDGRVLAEGPGS